MTDAIKGSYSDLKFHKSLGVARISIDVPLEQASKVVALLGTPTLNDTTYVAVARLRPDAKSPKVEAAEELLNGDYPEPPASPAASCDGASPQSAGGHARAEALSPERRSEIAKKAADARWNSAQEPDEFGHDLPPESRPKRPFHELPRSQQAGILCADPAFQEWLGQPNGEYAAATIRIKCDVKSRTELDAPDGPRPDENVWGPAIRWDRLVSQFRQETGRETEQRG